MQRIFVVHQWGSGPTGDWYQSVKKELEKLNCQVEVLEMPNTDTPVINEWVNCLSNAVGQIDNQTFFIGHSIGCQTILRYMETIEKPVGGSIFVAGWFNLENLESEEAEQIAKPWLTTPINLNKVKKVLPKSTLIISSNDWFGCFEENKQKFSELGSKIIVMPNAGHITREDGFTELPIAVEELKALVSWSRKARRNSLAHKLF